LDIPDVLGFNLEEACERLRNAGFESIRVIPTSPPRHSSDAVNGTFRVIRQRADGDGIIELTVCNPDICENNPS